MVRIRHKNESYLMRFLGIFLGKWFMESAWTTITPWTIWAPVGANLNNPTVIEHEMVHVRQMRKWWILWHLSYLLLPVPVLGAWCRWRWEREAYLVQIRARVRTIEQVVDTLWWRYGFPWPRGAMRKWFRAEIVRG